MVEYLSEYPGMGRYVVEECPEYRLLALNINGMSLQGIKRSMQTLEEVKTAVEQEGLALQYASKMLLKRHPELYGIAVRSNGLALKYVPYTHRYEGIYEDAVRSNPKALGLVPDDKQTGDLYLVAVRTDGRALEDVPRKHITKELVRAAFASDVRAIKYAPARFCDRKMALSAVSEYGSLLGYVPTRIINSEIASAAVANDGDALDSVPSRLITRALCEKAIQSEPLSIRYVPPRFFDELVGEAVTRDWRAIRYVSKPSSELLGQAFKQSPLAIEFFPPEKKTIEVCEAACSRDPKAFSYVPREAISARMLRSWLASFFDEDGARISSPTLEQMKSLKDVSKDQLRDPSVAALMRRLDKRETRSAEWVEKDSSFLVTEEITCGWDIRFSDSAPPGVGERYLDTFSVTSRVSRLDGLIELLGGDLSMVEFGRYSFDDYDPARHDLSSADVPVSTLKRLGAYDDTAYRRLVSAWAHVPEIHNPEEDASLVHVRNAMIPPERFESSRPIYYVSDLHLNHMLVNRFPDAATERQISDYLTDVAVRMVETAPESERNSVLLVLGDTSYNIDVARIFFSSLRKAWKGQIVCILGNHDLWDLSIQGPLGRYTPTVETVVDKYRDLLTGLDIWLLHNEVMVFHRDLKTYRIRNWQLDNMDDSELASLLYHSSYVILGGLGFSGYSDDYNAESGIYRDVVTSRADDIALSEKFSRLHERIRSLAPYANVIVASHTPMSDWSTSGYQPGWVYVSGHTHRNSFIENDAVRVYADNQVGYDAQSAGLLRFYVEGLYDPFRHLPDGIHEVELMDYRDFNHRRGIKVDSFTRRGRIIMLKRESVYLFLFVWEQTGNMYLLSGAQITRLEVQDPEYYYARMLPYASLVKEAFSSYMNAINTISNEVKAFGGDGRTHGCIVDIDHVNHVYLDPFTARLKFYCATSIDNRIEYEHLDSLLKHHAPGLLAPYEALLAKHTDSSQLLVKKGEDMDVVSAIHKTDTLMYRPSNVILSVQHLFESNVIRVWNEDVLGYEKPVSEELCVNGGSTQILGESPLTV